VARAITGSVASALRREIGVESKNVVRESRFIAIGILRLFQKS
jgi:hypothetical protein